VTALFPLAKARRGLQVSSAFIRMDARDTFNYPLGFVMRELGAAVPIVTFYFISRLVDREDPSVGGDYYTFVVIGIMGMTLLGAGLQTLSRQLQRAINQGRLEMVLVEPIRWRLLPFTMVQWNIVLAAVTALIMGLISLLLGARYGAAGLPAAVLIASLGILATLAIGILNASIKVLSKRADPVLTIYTIAATILSGTFYSLEVLPDFIRPLAWLIPHTYVLQALRKVLMGGGEAIAGPDAFVSMLALVGFSVVLYPIALWLYGRSMEFGRKMGVLSGY
jgi:ABC-2 type transport system permease protein